MRQSESNAPNGMTAHALAAALLAGEDRPVVVAGHGRLAFVTRGATVEGQRVTVIYVAEPEPDAEPEFMLEADGV